MGAVVVVVVTDPGVVVDVVAVSCAVAATSTVVRREVGRRSGGKAHAVKLSRDSLDLGAEGGSLKIKLKHGVVHLVRFS